MLKPIIPHVHNLGLLWTIWTLGFRDYRDYLDHQRDNGTMCMAPGLQITLGRPLQFLPGCPPGFLPVPLVLPVLISETVTHGRLQDYMDYWNHSGTINGIANGTPESLQSPCALSRSLTRNPLKSCLAREFILWGITPCAIYRRITH